MKKHNKIFKSLIAIIVAILMVGTLIPTVAFAGADDAAVVEEAQPVSPFASLIQTVRNFFRSILEFIRNLFAGAPKPVEPDVSAAKLNEIINAEDGAVIDGNGMIVELENTLILSKNITIKNITFEAADKSAIAVSISPATSVTLEKCNVLGRLWVSGKDIVLKGCTFDTNMNIDGVDGLLIEDCVFSSANPITFGSSIENVTIKNNVSIVPNAQVRIHENVTTISKVVIVKNDLPFFITPDLGALVTYNQAVSSGNFIYIK